MAAAMWAASFSVMMVTVTCGTSGILRLGLRASGSGRRPAERLWLQAVEPVVWSPDRATSRPALRVATRAAVAALPARSRSRRPTGRSRGSRAARCCAPAPGRAAPGTRGSSSTCRPRTSAARPRAAARRATARRACVSTRFWLVCTCRAASRTCVVTCSCWFFSCVCAWRVLQPRAGEVGLGLAGPDRIADVQRRRPGRDSRWRRGRRAPTPKPRCALADRRCRCPGRRGRRRARAACRRGPLRP